MNKISLAKAALATCALTAVLVVPAFAGEEKATLEAGPGVDLVRANCVACHSYDYIQMNSPFLDRKGWEATVNKMAKAFGAPIKDEDKEVIVNYLAGAYGKK